MKSTRNYNAEPNKTETKNSRANELDLLNTNSTWCLFLSCAFRLLLDARFFFTLVFLLFSPLLLNVGCCDFCVFFLLVTAALWLIVKDDDRSPHIRGSGKIRNIFSMFIFRHFLLTPFKWWLRCQGIGAIKGAKWLIKRTLTFISSFLAKAMGEE